jgi:hypothetical protein
MEYTVVRNWELEELIKEVNEKIQEGWEVCGGVSSFATTRPTVWAQAMIKEDKK